ncbi:hypothetical protein M422DRAFT_33387 [Sphaerobolus stellatus SS14]|uniref:Uncharacterized protein n=1 Tax=Sphaerobolus stellatus (strain SS14) TaxID=990650 RepID=A0A0C9URN4_SPHS4|nr:hypothetical protein M422DRAFT_37543 [Sphaerobolus stellatus SS14]KIJ38257.1 hypothetical protein M422DRAFT_33387 [Sphaerobolus stellatus SS14]
MPSTVNRVVSKLMRTATREESACPNCGAYKESGRSSKQEPVAEIAEMLDDDDMAW